MSLVAFLLIILSAVCHAGWNLIGKKDRMTMPFYGSLSLVCQVIWLHVFVWTPIQIRELPWEFWSYVFASVCCDGILYCVGLELAYGVMEMSTAYPMMRSLPILLTAAVTSVLGWGKPLSPMALLAGVRHGDGGRLQAGDLADVLRTTSYAKRSWGRSSGGSSRCGSASARWWCP